jgi:hypothetical protein
MINALKRVAKRLPYPLLMRTYYAWYFARKLTRFERTRRRLGLPRLSSVDLSRHKKSDTLFILGSGPSINQISSDRWEAIARHDSVGVNMWLYHRFVPTFYVVESASYSGPREKVCRELVRLSHLRGQDYANTIKIITDLYESDRQYVFDLAPEFRENLFAAYNVPLVARDHEEFERGLAYLQQKGLFQLQSRMGWLLKYGLSLSLLLTFGLRMGYKRVVLCGIDMVSQEYFYQDPAIYPENRGLCLVPRAAKHAADQKVAWMLPQSEVVLAMQRLLLQPAGVELFVETPASILHGPLALPPASVLEPDRTTPLGLACGNR